MATECTGCGSPLSDGAAFCGRCGARRVDPLALQQYEAAVSRLAPQGGLGPAEDAQLATLRAQLGLDLQAHRETLARLRVETLPAPGVALALDEATLGHFQPGAAGLLRFRVSLVDGQPLAEVSVAGAGLHHDDGAPVLPGGEATLSVGVAPLVAGVHELHATLSTVSLRGARRVYAVEPLLVRVGAGGPQVVHIDQRSARVVDNSGLELGGAPLVRPGAWRALTLRPLSGTGVPPVEPPPPPPRPPPLQAPVGFEVEAGGRSFRADGVLAEGDIATVYTGWGEGQGAAGDRVAIKVVRDRADNDLMQAEVQALGLLRGVASPLHKHLPVVLGQLRTSDGRMGTVFEALDGLDLGTIRQRFPEGIPSRHLVWIARRALGTLGFAHSQGVLHGNVDPAHLIVRASDHNAWLVDWSWSIVRPAETGQRFKALNALYSPPEAEQRRPPTPASDLYSLGRVLIFAAGGDPATGAPPEHLEAPIARLLRFMALGSQGGRAQDAYDLFRRFDKAREELWGPHRFEEFHIPPG